MRTSSSVARGSRAIVMSLLLLLGLVSAVAAQSQEPKPGSATSTTTPTADSGAPEIDQPATGVDGASWLGPTWGLGVTWDPAIWNVENELLDDAYDGLQIGTPRSTVFFEAYEGFDGDAGSCLAAAEQEIRDRESVSEVARLDGRPLPDVAPGRRPHQLFGVVATMPDGALYRGVEYVECRTLVPGLAVAELTWQTAASNFNAELPLVEALLTALDLPGSGGPSVAATPVA